MSGSVNRVILIGNLGKDPEVMRLVNQHPEHYKAISGAWCTAWYGEKAKAVKAMKALRARKGAR
jgi:single-stranded DNA-binding protein